MAFWWEQLIRPGTGIGGGAGTLTTGEGTRVGAGSQPNRQTLCCKGPRRASVFYHKWTSGFTMNSSQPAFSFVSDLGIAPIPQPQTALTLEDTCPVF